MKYTVSSLVRAREREWVVLPGSTDALLRLRPLGGLDLEETALLPALEKVEPATFSLPDPEKVGDAHTARLLRDAVRLGFRSSAGPFRSFGAISVEPRPYQLVPLLMALRQQPVRLLIADDVGIGKTIEALLIAKELLARGEVERVCVLCPPHLAEQWQTELQAKFGLEAALVLSGTVAGLERQCLRSLSVFEHFPVTVVSLDYIKQERRREEFLRTCPELVIVDEAHACTQVSRYSQQRFQLLRRISQDASRHLILVTATPHSGKEMAFRSLLSLLKPEFEQLPDDLSGDQNRRHREALARHLVQRRRADVHGYLQEQTPFPERSEDEVTYELTDAYRDLLSRAVAYAREVVRDHSGTQYQQRLRWWSALALLRSIGSSPPAAVATLRSRYISAESDSVQEAEAAWQSMLMDSADEETAESGDVPPGADLEQFPDATRRRFAELARAANALMGAADPKLRRLTEVVLELLQEGFNPIVFCKYIPTAKYVAEHLSSTLKDARVACVTGEVPHGEREERVRSLAEENGENAGQARKWRVLVCTDCLSEGINLQEWFDAAVHADLAWSPTRHEQREGRVDRFGQPSRKVRLVTLYGKDNPVDGIVLDILLRKHRAIRNALGVSVPVPTSSEEVLEAIFQAALLKGDQSARQLAFAFEELEPKTRDVHQEWDRSAEREKRSRTLFAQHSIQVEEVRCELEAAREAVGSSAEVERFVREAVHAAGGFVASGTPPVIHLDEAKPALRDMTGYKKPLPCLFQGEPRRGAAHLNRTHPFVEGLAAFVLDTALSGEEGAIAARCGVMATDAVDRVTALLLLRMRFQMLGQGRDLFAEDCALAAFTGAPRDAVWLPEERVAALLEARPRANVGPDVARHLLRRYLAEAEALLPALRALARERAARVLEAHHRVRAAAQGLATAREVRPQGDPDILGFYLYQPHAGGA